MSHPQLELNACRRERMKLLNPTIDLVFKLLLTRNLELLRSMLEAILAESITDFSVVDPAIPGDLAADKAIVIDVRVVLADGRRAIVEMQVRATSDLQSRLVYYTARDFANQAKRGQSYASLTPTVTIVWLVHPLFPSLNRLHSIFELRERSTHEAFSNDLALHLLQLSEDPPQTASGLTSAERRVRLWARFLSARTADARALLAAEDPIMATAIETLEQLSADPEVARQAEERELSRYFYELSLLNAKKEGLLQGKQEGLLQGKQEGLLEGERQGHIKGRRDTLVHLLHSKFGALPEGAETRLREATETDLARWMGRLLSAVCLEEVFSD